MATDDKEIVTALAERIAKKVGRQRFELWFGENTRLALSATSLKVTSSSEFFQDWLRKNFRRDIEDACAELHGEKLRVEFQVDPALAGSKTGRSTASESTAQATTSPSTTTCPPHGERPADRSASPEAAPAFGRRRFASLESFVVGGSNRLAFTSAQVGVERPGSVSPLLIHGATGLGKTHLLEGIRTAARKNYRRAHAVYLTAEQFTTHFLQALSGQGLPSFRRKYRGVDFLLIDDVHFFAGKKATLTELLYTIDTLLAEGKQLVFTADRPPAKLTGLGPELVARLSGGLVCRIDPPDFVTRLEITRALSRRLDVRVSDDVLALVATRVTSHARELAGALHRLQATSRALDRPIDGSLAEEALSQLAQQNHQPVRLPDIQEAVCDVFGIAPETLRSDRKTKAVSHPRMLAMWLARKHTRAALSEIGQFFGRRSHSTVISASKKVETWMRRETSLALSDAECDVEEAIRRVEATLRRA